MNRFLGDCLSYHNDAADGAPVFHNVSRKPIKGKRIVFIFRQSGFDVVILFPIKGHLRKDTAADESFPLQQHLIEKDTMERTDWLSMIKDRRQTGGTSDAIMSSLCFVSGNNFVCSCVTRNI